MRIFLNLVCHVYQVLKVMNELRSFQVALRGILAATRSEKHMKFHLVAAVFTLAAALLLKFSPFEWIILIVVITGMLALEMINTALETLVDLVEPNWNEKAGKVKDIAAGACLVYACGAAVIGCILYIPKLLALFG